MKESIKQELLAHLKQRVEDEAINESNFEDAHYHAFNEDYYIIGYYKAEQWLKEHYLSPFEAISTCIEYEKEIFGEVSKVYDNAEETVNMLAYIYGDELTPQSNTWEEFLTELNK